MCEFLDLLPCDSALPFISGGGPLTTLPAVGKNAGPPLDNIYFISCCGSFDNTGLIAAEIVGFFLLMLIRLF